MPTESMGNNGLAIGNVGAVIISAGHVHENTILRFIETYT